MSWDLMMLKAPLTKAQMDAPDFAPAPLGDADSIRSKISRTLPRVDWSNLSQGAYDEDDVQILFDLGEDDELGTVDIEASRQPEAVVPILSKLCKEHGWCLFDMETAEFLGLG